MIIYLLLGIFLAVATTAGIIAISIALAEKGSKSIEVPREVPKEVKPGRDVSTPEGYFECVKDSLPKNRGLIYSVKSSIDHYDDHIVEVKIIDPLTDKQLGAFNLDSSRTRSVGGIKGEVNKYVNSAVKKWELEKFAGREEIIS